MLNCVTTDFSSLLSILRCKAVPGVGQFVESLKIKIQNIRVGGVEKKINFLQHPQALLVIQKKPPRHHPPPNKSSASLDVLDVSATFCFRTYLRLCFILISCSSVNTEQILHSFSIVTQGSSPSPASLQDQC